MQKVNSKENETMINFGTSAYLKILALNPRPKDTQLKNRLTPSDSGYDFHRSMRQIAPKFAAGKLDAEATVKALSSIKKTPERLFIQTFTKKILGNMKFCFHCSKPYDFSYMTKTTTLF